MKKDAFKLALKNSAAVKLALKNAFTEDGQAAYEALVAFMEEIGNSEVEVSAEDLGEMLKEKIAEIAKVNVEEEVANQLAKRLSALQNGINKELPLTVKNQIATAVLSSHGREEVRNAVEAVAVKNGITGLSFSELVDYAVVDGWGNSNPLFAALKETPFTQFFYNEDDLHEAAVLAKQWNSLNEEDAEKLIQEVAVTGKTIAPDYIYKRQQVSRKDLARLDKRGDASTFMRWLNEELDRQIINTIVMAMLVGDTVNAQGSRVTSFETIGTKTQSDLFTSVVNPEVAEDFTLGDVRRMCDRVRNPYGKKKWLCISQTGLTHISAFVYAAGGSSDFFSIDELKGKLGVDEIFVTDILENDANIRAICMIPEAYWYVQDEYLSVSYPTWEKNVENFQKERNIGGGIHDAFSTAVLREAE